MDAGLTVSQARVYLALSTLCKADGKTIWRCSGVARQDVYRILAELQKEGLVEKIITHPTEFKATPMHVGLPVLLKRKADKYKEVEAKVERLLQRAESYSQENAAVEQQFILIPEKEAHARRVGQAFMSAQKSLSTIMLLPDSKPKDIKQLPSLLKEAIARGVVARQISNKPKGYKEIPKPVVWRKNGSFELRYTHEPLPIMFFLVDDKEVFFATEPHPNPIATSALWTNNLSLVTLAKAYFEMMWQSTEEQQKRQSLDYQLSSTTN